MTALPTLRQLVSGDELDALDDVRFVECRDGALWYRVLYLDDAGAYRWFDFPIPLEDVAGATFPASDPKRVYYMRWLRRHLAELEAALAEAALSDTALEIAPDATPEKEAP